MKKLLCMVLLLCSTVSFAAEVKPGVFDSKTGVFTYSPIQEPRDLDPIRFVPEKTIVLTDAKDLSDWDNGEGKPTTGWEIKEGIIRRIGGKDDLFYKGDYDNFILEFEFKVTKGGNSGVFYYAWCEKKRAHGFEYQIIDDIHRRVHPTLERYATAGLYTLYHRWYQAVPMDLKGYNKGKIIVLGNHIEHWLNGNLAVSVQTGTENWKDHIKQSRSSESPNFGKMKSGRIAFQNHDHEVFFRNIRLTPYKKASSDTAK